MVNFPQEQPKQADLKRPRARVLRSPACSEGNQRGKVKVPAASAAAFSVSSVASALQPRRCQSTVLPPKQCVIWLARGTSGRIAACAMHRAPDQAPWAAMYANLQRSEICMHACNKQLIISN